MSLLGINSFSGLSIVTAILVALLAYLVLVRSQRWKRTNALHAKFAGRSMESITPEEAQTIVHGVSMWDMPAIHTYALSFALFKTYAIPTISAILAHTKEFSSKELVSKRYADTELLITTFLHCPMSGFYGRSANEVQAEVNARIKVEADPRAMIALARVNMLHGRYKISNNDYLYTLSVFILEPITWARRYSWRPLTELECQAFFIYWIEIGKRMSIQQLPNTVEELIVWRDAYEAECMVPAKSNHDVAGYTIEELLHSVPEHFGIKAFARRIIICTLEDHIRVAMMYPPQPWYLRLLTQIILRAVGPFQRYLMLPRSKPHSLVPVEPTPNGLMHAARFQAKPWYKPESKGMGWYTDRFLVAIGYYDYMPGPQFKSEGFRLEEMGPQNMEKVGHEEVMRNAAKLQGCPVTGPFSLEGRK